MVNTPIRRWTRLLGTSALDAAYSVSASADGSIYVAGVTRGSLDGQTNSGQSDAFISKYNSEGTKDWTRLLGTSLNENAFSISTATDGSIYICGSSLGPLDGQTNSGGSDAFISKYKSDGTREWTRLLGTSAVDAAYSISTAADGSIYIAGNTRGSLAGQTNSGQSDAFLSKYSSDGTEDWTRLLGSPSLDGAFSISTAVDGSIYITGSTLGSLSGQTNSGERDVFISRYRSDGTKDWTRLLGSPSFEGAFSISTTADGTIYIAGSTAGSLDGQINSGERDAFLSKYSRDGSREWTRLLGTSSLDSAYSVTTVAGGSIFVIGTTRGSLDGQTNRGQTDAFFSKYNSDGSREWTRLLGTSSDDNAYSISSTADGSFYIAGDTRGSLDGQENRGRSDAFISKYTINNIPNNFDLSVSSFDENIAEESVIATLTNIGGDDMDSQSYVLVSGEGDADNSSFVIEEDQIKIIDKPDFETKDTYSIRIQSNNEGSLSIEKAFILSVNDTAEPQDPITGLLGGPKRIKPNYKPSVKFVLFGSDKIDVNKISLDSLIFGGDRDLLISETVPDGDFFKVAKRTKVRKKGSYYATIKDINDDGQDDLLVNALRMDVLDAMDNGDKGLFAFGQLGGNVVLFENTDVVFR